MQYLDGANEKELNLLTEYASKIGLAFQIKDDILSEVGNEKIMGKPVHNDVKENKSTFVTKYGIDKSCKMLDEIINEVINIIDSNFPNKGEFLIELAKYIRDREK